MHNKYRLCWFMDITGLNSHSKCAPVSTYLKSSIGITHNAVFVVYYTYTYRNIIV